MFNLRSWLLAASLCLLPACSKPKTTYSTQPESVNLSAQFSQIQAVAPFVTRHEVEQGSSLYQTLKREGLSAPTILELVKIAEPIFPLEDVGAGTPVEITWDGPERNAPLKLSLRYAVDTSLSIERSDPGQPWIASQVAHPISIVQKTFHGLVESSLWESAELVGMDPSLITNLAEVFAWQIDFNREVKRGDRWRLTVEQKIIDEKAIGFGNILVAEYENGSQSFTGIRFPAKGEGASYYFPNGQSLKRMFIKSPIKFGRITSGFSHNRFHPILRESRPHNGVDYGAPIGTPVMAVGRGVIDFVGRNGGSGNMIKVRHNASYATAYLHLNGFAPGMRHGTEVEQGQIIGYVGASGLATGPHLHFAFFENGTYVDPLGLKFPSADPISKTQLPAFQLQVENLMKTLPDWQIAQRESSPISSGESPLSTSKTIIR